MISDVLMNRAHQVGRLCVGDFETKLALGICLCASRFFHALPELEQNDFVPGRWFASRRILHYASESLSASDRTEEEDKCEEEAGLVLHNIRK